MARSQPKVPQLIVPLWGHSVPVDWVWARLWDICRGVIDCPHSTPKVVTESRYLMARTQDVLGGVFRAGQAARVSEETYQERIRQAEPQCGDLLYSREGTYFGNAAEVPDGVDVCLGQRMVLLQPEISRVDPTFLRGWLNSPQMQSHIHGFRDGSVAERLNLPTIRGLPVALPPLPEQQRIAAILGALDDKIELNRRMNQTLEEMASAVFKSWFVDFDGHEDLVDSELGLIPRGWGVKPVGEVLELAYGKSLPAKTRVPGPVPVYGSGGIGGTHREALVRGPGIVVGRKGTIGTVYWVEEDFFPIDTTFFVKVKSEALSLRWAFLMLGIMDIAHLGADSAVPGVNRNAVYAQPWVLPPVARVRDFERIASPLMERMRAAVQESDALVDLRDTLLPKLISGELRVPEAEEMVEGAYGS